MYDVTSPVALQYIYLLTFVALLLLGAYIIYLENVSLLSPTRKINRLDDGLCHFTSSVILLKRDAQVVLAASICTKGGKRKALLIYALSEMAR